MHHETQFDAVRDGISAVALATVLSAAGPGALNAQEKPDFPYQAFKLMMVKTDCTVPRFAGDAPGATAPGPAGGVTLTDDEARKAYTCAKPEMADAYEESGHAVALGYTQWENYSTAPYLSATHGNRYVNNYANLAARNYELYEDGGEMEVGAVVAKDGFAVNANGEVFFGVLSVMEKMPEGFNPEAGDWRYTMILPDGKVFGTTGGRASAKVDFCASCHAAAGSEALFFVPKPYRIERPKGRGR